MPIKKSNIALSMQLWFPARGCEAFSFLRVGHRLDGIGGRSYQSLVEDAAHPKIEVAIVVHTWSNTSYDRLDPWQLGRS